MPGPRPQKKRKILIDSSNEFLDSRFESSSVVSHRTATSTTQSVIKPRTQAFAQSTKNSNSKPSLNSRPKISNSNIETPQATNLVPPRKKELPKKARKLSGKYKSLHSFWGVPPDENFSSTTGVASKSLSRDNSSASPNEDVNDLIEDLSDDFDSCSSESIKLLPKPLKDGKLMSHLIVSKSGINRGPASLLALKGPRSSQDSSKIKVKKQEDSRPWAEKFAPEKVEDLALNKAKVKEVRTWLENVFNCSLRQRLLVLKGSAGTGKTATLNALAKDMDIDILEWHNPLGTASEDEYGEEGSFATSLSAIFEEFVGRAGTFGSLNLVASSQEASGINPRCGDDRKKVVVIEDFPNTLFTSSPTPLKSFRHTIKSFLALPASSSSTAPLPPLILIITETPSASVSNSFTAQRLLSPEILNHRFTREINFNKIAPTYMFKALTAIIHRESRESGRKFGPSKPVLEALSTTGDIRSAVMGLEFLAMNDDISGGGFSEPIFHEKKRRIKKPIDRELNDQEKRLVEAVTQRETTYGIFHTVGKIVYNKRYGDDPEDPYVPQQPQPNQPTLPYHPRAIRIDLESLVDETGTDPQTLIAAIHENFLGSCNPGGQSRLASTADGDILDVTNACLDYLSDSDILSSCGFSNRGSDFNTVGIRADEIAFQTAVRGVMLSLPSPVKRFHEPKGKSTKIFYPISARLWRKRQEVADMVEWFIDWERENGRRVGGRAEALEERIPYTALVERRKEWAHQVCGNVMNGRMSFLRNREVGQRLDPVVKKALEKITTFKGVGTQSEEEPVDDNYINEANDLCKSIAPRDHSKDHDENLQLPIRADIESLILSDDDIEDF